MLESAAPRQPPIGYFDIRSRRTAPAFGTSVSVPPETPPPPLPSARIPHRASTFTCLPWQPR